MEIKANKYAGKDILRFIRENTNLTQKEFAKNIDKSRDWQASNEIGRFHYSIDDLIKIANTYNLEIIIKDKNKKLHIILRYEVLFFIY